MWWSLLPVLGFASFITWCLSGSIKVHRAGHVAMLIIDWVFFSKRQEEIVAVSSLNGWPYLHYQHLHREFLSSVVLSEISLFLFNRLMKQISFSFLSQGAWCKWMAKHRISVWCYQLFEFAGSLWSTTDRIKRYPKCTGANQRQSHPSTGSAISSLCGKW